MRELFLMSVLKVLSSEWPILVVTVFRKQRGKRIAKLRQTTLCIHTYIHTFVHTQRKRGVLCVYMDD